MPPRDRPSPADTNVVGARIGAQIIDLVFLWIQLVVVAMLLDVGRPGILLGALTLPLYGGLLEGYWNGQTIGKRALDIKVVDQRGREATLAQAFVRNLPAVLLPGWLAYMVALAAMAMTDRRQRIFDQVAGTVVVGEGYPV